VRHLPLQPASSLDRHVRERRPELRGDRRRHRSLDERGLAEEHATPLLGCQQLERGLGAEDGAAEIHQHEHAVAGVGLGDRLRHADRIRTEGGLRGLDPSGEL
jgi:hypothetical protein